MRRSLPFIIIGAVLLLAVGIGWKMLAKHGSGSNSAIPATPAPGPVKPKPPTGVVVTIEEFGDYQCPPCGLLYPELKKIEAEYGSNLHVVFRHLPLTRIHKNALAAAQAAEAARLQNRFEEMHDRLYLNQKKWAEEADPVPVFVGYARELGLDSGRFTRDMASPEVNNRITADSQQAVSRGVTGTPTLLIEGHQLRPEATTPEGIRRGIDFLLAKKASAPAG
jgi:protein-disulfide isomerase